VSRFSHIRDIARKRAQKNKKRSNHHDIELVKRAKNKRIPSIRQVLHITNLFEKKQKRVFVAALVICIMSALATVRFAMTSYQVEVPRVHGSYTEGVIGSPQLINPLFSQLNDADQDLVALIYSGLMRYDEERSLVPDIAVNYHISEDNLSYTFTLKENVYWHDGEMLTANDVVYTYEVVQDSQVNSPLAVSFKNVVVDRIDDYTVQFTLPEPYPSFLASLTMGILPEHVWAGIPNSQLRLANRNVNPIGSGPFKFNELFKDQTGYIHRVELERFSDFYRNAPYIEDVAFEYFNDYDGPTGVISALREKRIDGVHFVPFDMREKIARKNIALHTLQLPQYTALFFNLDASQLEDADVRKGLVHALDRGRIIREVLENEAKLIDGPILEGFPGYDVNVSGYEFSIETANELLDSEYARISADEYRTLIREEKLQALIDAEREQLAHQAPAVEENTTDTSENIEDTEQTATETVENTATSSTPDIDEEALGALVDEELNRTLDAAQLFYRYPKGGDDKKNIFEIDLVTVSRPEYISVAELVAGYWQDIGIRVNIRLVDVQDLSRQALRERDYDVLLYGVIVGNDPDQYPFWHSSQAGYPGLNLSQYVSKDADETLEAIRTSVTDAERAELYRAFQEKIISDVPAAFLYTPTYTYALTSKMQGFETSRIARPSDRFADVANWYLDTRHVWRNK